MVLQNWPHTPGTLGSKDHSSHSWSDCVKVLVPQALFLSPCAFAWWFNASKFDLVMGKLFSFGTLRIMCNFKTRVWVHYNYFEIPYAKMYSKTFFLWLSHSLLLLPVPQITNRVIIVFSCFQQSLLKSWMCVHDKYTPVATCKRNKPQHENTKAFLFSYVNKSPDGSFVRLCLLILVFFLDNLFPVTILSWNWR